VAVAVGEAVAVGSMVAVEVGRLVATWATIVGVGSRTPQESIEAARSNKDHRRKIV
jgi:hypothetical protein